MNLCSQKGAYRYARLMSYLIAEVDFKMSFLCFQNCYTKLCLYSSGLWSLWDKFDVTVV